MAAYSPKLIKTSNNVKPIVAPETKENVFLNPCAAPEEIITILTGPGENDRASANISIVTIKTIYLSVFQGEISWQVVLLPPA